MMKDLEDKRTQALKDVQDIYGDQSLFERDQLLKRIVFKTRNRLWRKGWCNGISVYITKKIVIEAIK